MFIRDTEISFIQGDITELAVDALVNAANNRLLMGGGVAAAIKKKGGAKIEEEALKKGPIEIGEAVYTGAGRLAARYVIHAATMGMDFKTDEAKIRGSCRSALAVAEGLKCASIAFPALGCGVGGFPLKASARIMAQEVLRHIRDGRSSLKRVVFCLFDKKSLEVFSRDAGGYLDFIVNKLIGPFVTVDVIIEFKEGIVLIKRSNPPFGYALPGGFVDYGESLEQAVRREAREETGLVLEDLRQFHTYSAPDRDPRFHSIGVVFVARGRGTPTAGDDACGIKVMRPEGLDSVELAFDHKKIIQDYLRCANKPRE